MRRTGLVPTAHNVALRLRVEALDDRFWRGQPGAGRIEPTEELVVEHEFGRAVLATKALNGNAQSRCTTDGKQGCQAIRDRIVEQRKLDRVRGAIGGWVVATAGERGASAKARPPGDLNADGRADLVFVREEDDPKKINKLLLSREMN